MAGLMMSITSQEQNFHQPYSKPDIPVPEMIGLGIGLLNRDGKAFVNEVLPGFGADVSGNIQEGDILEEFDGVNVSGIPFEALDRHVMGPLGSHCRVVVTRFPYSRISHKVVVPIVRIRPAVRTVNLTMPRTAELKPETNEESAREQGKLSRAVNPETSVESGGELQHLLGSKDAPSSHPACLSRSGRSFNHSEMQPETPADFEPTFVPSSSEKPRLSVPFEYHTEHPIALPSHAPLVPWNTRAELGLSFSSTDIAAVGHFAVVAAHLKQCCPSESTAGAAGCG